MTMHGQVCVIGTICLFILFIFLLPFWGAVCPRNYTLITDRMLAIVGRFRQTHKQLWLPGREHCAIHSLRKTQAPKALHLVTFKWPHNYSFILHEMDPATLLLSTCRRVGCSAWCWCKRAKQARQCSASATDSFYSVGETHSSGKANSIDAAKASASTASTRMRSAKMPWPQQTDEIIAGEMDCICDESHD